jgi:hypothetical protein
MRLTNLNRWFNQQKEFLVLSGSIAVANEIALMLQGRWDGCNGVSVSV